MTQYEVGLSVDNQKSIVSITYAMLGLSAPVATQWEEAIQTAMDMAQAIYPDARIEFDFCKEYDNG